VADSMLHQPAHAGRSPGLRFQIGPLVQYNALLPCGQCRAARSLMTKKLYIETVGCQMNVLDSELVVGTLRRVGYEITHEPTDADVIFFNTRRVRQHAEDKVYSALGRLRGHMQRQPDKVLGVLGCMAQKDQEK